MGVHAHFKEHQHLIIVDVIGDISYTGSIGPSSDQRLKKDIKEIDCKKAVELVNTLFLKHISLLTKKNTAIGRVVVLLPTI